MSMRDRGVTLSIDGIRVTVPEGTLIVDAAKKAGIDIPVFCYHPKMTPVGMCRMCLVEVGRPVIDRDSGQPVLDEHGEPVIQFGPKLETACTTPVGEGWVVRGLTERVRQARREVLEFLLTSHPLDCPVCDKGGECPLQNLTMAHGPGKSRFLYDDKKHLAKRLPLGDLIFLDRERCIQCGRCVRFQEEIAGDPVLAFTDRGRGLEIVSLSEPGFDSIFSGNTTDICPVGALTTVDFRFEARPWELKAAASICPHCPVGCNLTLNTRRQPDARGRILVQRVMPRQNEAVNELWICDKGRFGHHYTGSPDRLQQPLVRDAGGNLVAVSWEEALTKAVEGLSKADGKLVGVAGGKASNEDLFNFRLLMEGLGGRAVLDSPMAGGDVVQQVGAGSAWNLSMLGEGDAALVVASDLHEEAPIWWLRLKKAAERGLRLVVINMRPTRLDRCAAQVVRVGVGCAPHAVLGLIRSMNDRGAAGPEVERTSAMLKRPRRLVVFFGSEGLDYHGTGALARACAGLLLAADPLERAASGLVAVWPEANVQGAWDMGLRPEPGGVAAALRTARAAYLMACDPAREDPAAAAALGALDFVVVQDLFASESSRWANVVLPAQSFVEREGSYTSGERRVQRFYPALPPLAGSRPDWEILAELGTRLGIPVSTGSVSRVMEAIAAAVPDYAHVTYGALARVEPQWPLVGGNDLHYGGTAYRNDQGTGVPLVSPFERGDVVRVERPVPPEPPAAAGLLLVPVAHLYEPGATLRHSSVLLGRFAKPTLTLAPGTASRLRLEAGQRVEVVVDGRSALLTVGLDEQTPEGVGLVSRRCGLGVERPAAADVRAVAQMETR